MADSPSVTCESGAGQAVSDLSGGGDLEAGQLGALRSVLLGPLYHDLEVLRARIAELEDPNRQAARISEHLPRALSLRPSTDPEIAAAFSPLIEAVVWEGRGRDLGRQGGGVAHGVKRWLWHCLSTPAHLARAMMGSGQRTAVDGEILGLVLVHRATHALMEQFMRPRDDLRESRSIASMLAFLQLRLHDEAFLAGYEKLECLRVEELTYGIHVRPRAILFSVIRGRHPEAALARCKASLEAMHQAHAVALEAFDPGQGQCALLPADLRGAGEA